MTDSRTERFRALLDQVGAAHNYDRGWKTRVAAAIDVHPSYVSRVLARDPRLRVSGSAVGRLEELAGAGVPSLPSRRFHALIEQLRDEFGGARGWIAQAARRVDVHRSTLVKVLKGAPVSSALIERTRVALDLDGRFFTDASIGDAPSYLAHVVGSRADHQPRDPEVDALAAIARLDAAAWARVRAWGDARHENDE